MINPQLVSQILAVFTIAANVLLLGLAMIWIGSYLSKNALLALNALTSRVGRSMIWLTFSISLFSMSGSLYFSEVAGYATCLLCWYQRIAMYPLTVFQGVALFEKRKTVWNQVLALSLIGLCFALIHYAFQIGALPVTDCEAIGYARACSDHFSLRFGYITLSFMSATAFSMLAAGALLGKRYESLQWQKKIISET